MPVLGWLAGGTVIRAIRGVDHWIAFGLLAFIGVTCFSMTVVGALIGPLVGRVVGKRAELLGGLVLIGIGAKILAEHLGG